jgi:hypothetical protein
VAGGDPIAAALASGIVQAVVLRTEQPLLTHGSILPILLVGNYLILDNAFNAAILLAEGLSWSCSSPTSAPASRAGDTA